MIAVDTSAIAAILFDEPDKARFLDAITSGEKCVMSAVNVHELALVLCHRKGTAAVEVLWAFLSENEIEVVPFDLLQVRTAVVAHTCYGKGIDPNARLNLCDCAAYACQDSESSASLQRTGFHSDGPRALRIASVKFDRRRALL